MGRPPIANLFAFAALAAGALASSGCVAGAGYAYTPRPVTFETQAVPPPAPPAPRGARPLYEVAPG